MTVSNPEATALYPNVTDTSIGEKGSRDEPRLRIEQEGFIVLPFQTGQVRPHSPPVLLPPHTPIAIFRIHTGAFSVPAPQRET